MPGKLHAALIVAAVAIGLAACSNGGDDSAKPTTTRPAPTTTTTLVPGVKIDWKLPKPVDLGGGWTLADCEGNAPLFCASFGGEIVGTVEVLRLDPEGKTVEQHAADFIDTFRVDRAHCKEGYTVTPLPLTAFTAPDGDGWHYGFDATYKGAVVEYVVHWAGIRHGKLVIVAANGLDAQACESREGEFDVAHLRDFETRLDPVVRASGLP